MKKKDIAALDRKLAFWEATQAQQRADQLLVEQAELVPMLCAALDNALVCIAGIEEFWAEERELRAALHKANEVTRRARHG